MTPELVIFDCDGVLVDSEIITTEVVVQSLARYGLTLSLDKCMDLFVGVSDEYMQSTAKEMGAKLPHDWLEEIDRDTFTRLKAEVTAVDGVVDIIDRLENLHIAFCVASNGSEEKMAITLGRCGLLERFEGVMFSAYSVGISKPDPGLFLHAAQKLNVAPDACVVIEDSPSGAKAAQSAGMKCFGYAPHNAGQKLVNHGAGIFHDMAQLGALLEL